MKQKRLLTSWLLVSILHPFKVSLLQPWLGFVAECCTHISLTLQDEQQKLPAIFALPGKCIHLTSLVVYQRQHLPKHGASSLRWIPERQCRFGHTLHGLTVATWTRQTPLLLSSCPNSYFASHTLPSGLTCIMSCRAADQGVGQGFLGV